MTNGDIASEDHILHVYMADLAFLHLAMLRDTYVAEKGEGSMSIPMRSGGTGRRRDKCSAEVCDTEVAVSVNGANFGVSTRDSQNV